MYLFIAVAYVLGGALVGAGIYLMRRDEFPSWWRRWLLWPLIRVTPQVTHLQGWAAMSLGLSVLAIGFTPIVPEIVGGVLVLLAILAYVVAAVLFGYSAYISRRAAS